MCRNYFISPTRHQLSYCTRRYFLSSTRSQNHYISILISSLPTFFLLFFSFTSTLFLVFQACYLCGIEEVNSKLSRVFSFISTESISLKCPTIFRTRYMTRYYPYLRPISFFFFFFIISQSVSTLHILHRVILVHIFPFVNGKNFDFVYRTIPYNFLLSALLPKASQTYLFH
jgi:hypothetical protein